MNVRPIHLRASAAVVVAAMAVAACSPSPAAGPLSLEQRVPGAEEAPGSEADPVETTVMVTGLDEFEARILSDVPDVTDEDVRVLEDAGFVAAIRDTRFYPTEPGGGHTFDAVHLFTLVLQFESAEGARDAVELVQDFELRTCPDTCAFASAEFDVDGTPDALGAQRIATQESLDAVGDPGEPQAVYAITFADGPFVYDVALSGAPDEVSEQEAEEIIRALHERVMGAPPAESD
jgi:hypothetical protein